MENPARLAERESDFAFLVRPFLFEEAPVLGLKPFKLPLLLKGDLQLGEVEIFCITETL